MFNKRLAGPEFSIFIQTSINMRKHFAHAFCLLIAVTAFFPYHTSAQSNITYDIVIIGGRVIDPETKLDAVTNIGILNNHIATIGSEPLKGKETINARGLVVSPGFIDMHVHGRSNKEQEYQLHDGITTALELEWGIEFLKQWYETRRSKALINYGASVCWPFERFRAMAKYSAKADSLLQVTLKGESKIETLFNTIGPSYTETLSNDEMSRMLANIKTSLEEGGIGIGVPIGYLPETNPAEMYRVYELAGELNALVFSHVREPNIYSIQEAMTDAMLNKTPLHLVHINSK